MFTFKILKLMEVHREAVQNVIGSAK